MQRLNVKKETKPTNGFRLKKSPSSFPIAANLLVSMSTKLEDVGVLMTSPMYGYLEQELNNRFKLFKLWESPSKTKFLDRYADSILAVVGDTKIGADADLIESLPHLRIVATYSVGLDKIDLDKCREKGIRVANTPDVLTDDVSDIAIGLALATLRKICACDTFVRSGLWKNGDFQLCSKVCGFFMCRIFGFS